MVSGRVEQLADAVESALATMLRTELSALLESPIPQAEARITTIAGKKNRAAED
jgi:hypothetical protein